MIFVQILSPSGRMMGRSTYGFRRFASQAPLVADPARHHADLYLCLFWRVGAVGAVLLDPGQFYSRSGGRIFRNLHPLAKGSGGAARCRTNARPALWRLLRVL